MRRGRAFDWAAQEPVRIVDESESAEADARSDELQIPDRAGR